MAQFLGSAFQQALDASANPYSGGLIYVYASGTTTLVSLFSNEGLSTPTANPIVADSSGSFAPVYVAETRVKLVLKTSAGVTVRTVDPVYSVGQADNVSAANVSYDGTALGFSSTNLQDAIAELAASFILSPPTTVDNTLPRFDGVNGQVQASSIVVADTTNDVTGIGQITQTATGANTIPVGTTAQRPAVPAAGMTRYNSTTGKWEFRDASAWVSPIFVRSFESTQQTITLAGSLTLAHGLGVQPKLYAAFLQCTTAEGGYSIADETQINPNNPDPGSVGRGQSMVPDATNINIRYGSGNNVIVHKTTGVAFSITNASWRLVVRAWA